MTAHPGLSHPDPERIPASLADPAGAADPWAVRACGPPGSGTDVLALASAVRTEVGAAYT